MTRRTSLNETGCGGSSASKPLEQTELSLDELQQGALDPLDPMHRHLSVFGDGSGPGLA